MKRKRMLAMASSSQPHRLRLYGVIGWDITPADVVAQLDELAGADVEVRVASPGGFVDDALAIYTALRGYEGGVSVIVDGVAASAASWVAMAGDEIWMGVDSLMMVHGPWTMTMGDAAQLRADADVLDRYSGIMRRAYGRHGYDGDDLLSGGDHWYDAAQALDAGLITGVLDSDDENTDEARAQVLATLLTQRRREVPDYEVPDEIAARLREYARTTEGTDVKTKQRKGRIAPLAVTTEEVDQLVEDLEELVEDAEDGEEIPAEDIEEVVDDVIGDDATDEEEGDGEEMTPATAIARERERVQVINRLAARGYFSQQQRDRLIARGVSANRARAAAVELGARQQTRITAHRGGDAVERRRAGMVQALVSRGLGTPTEQGNEWRGRSLVSMAAACHPDLARHHDGAALIEAVLQGSHGQRYQASADGGIQHATGDFVNVLGDSIHRTMLIGFGEVEDTWSGWTNRAELRDFRPTPRVDLGAFAELVEVPELGEIPAQTLTDRGVTAQLRKYGGRFGISFESIVNDDLRVFTELPRKQGRAAKSTVASAVYSILVDNPVMGDAIALFDAGHGNLGAEDVDAEGLSARRAAMRRQTMPTGGAADADRVTNIMPRYLLVPPELYGYALELISAVLIDGGGSNVWAGSLQVVEEPRLTGTSDWFLAASGTEADTIEVAYLLGRDQPMLDPMDGWTVLGTEFRVILPFAVTLRDYRGLQKATGGAP